jgi:hypothetical protein
MAKPKRDAIRENRIHDEIIVDANGPEEQAMSWYYYLEGKLRFPSTRHAKLPELLRPSAKANLSRSGA